MDPTFIPRKTDLGVDEIRTRTLRIESRLRALLIQVDGQKRIADLQNTIGDTMIDDLRRLREMGLVQWDDSLAGVRKASATQ